MWMRKRRYTHLTFAISSMLRLTLLALRSVFWVDFGYSRRPLRSTPRADCIGASSS